MTKSKGQGWPLYRRQLCYFQPNPNRLFRFVSFVGFCELIPSKGSKQKVARLRRGSGVAGQEKEDLTQPPSLCDRVTDYLFKTVCGAALVASNPPPDGLAVASWALTFWICAACSFKRAVTASICFCCCAIVASSLSLFAWESFRCCASAASNFSTFWCSLRNSLSNIAFTWS